MPSLGKTVAIAILVALVAGPASAHAGLISSSPTDQEVLNRPPTEFHLRFGEDVERANISFIEPDGSVAKPVKVRLIGSTVRGAIDLPAKRGRWTLAFRVVSTDGHPVTSEINFTTTTGRAVAQVEPASAEPRFLDQHRIHLIWALVAGAAAIGLIVLPILRRN